MLNALNLKFSNGYFYFFAIVYQDLCSILVFYYFNINNNINNNVPLY